MKSTELQIRDWVISNRRGKNEIVKVISIDGGTSYCWLDADCYSGLIACEDIQPIPLTAEILEKNGFKYNIFDRWMNSRYDVAISEKDEFLFIWDRIQLDYVHELQHALRLCGLNDLAENFKI